MSVVVYEEDSDFGVEADGHDVGGVGEVEEQGGEYTALVEPFWHGELGQ